MSDSKHSSGVRQGATGGDGVDDSTNRGDADDVVNVGDGTVCIACERKRLGGRPYKHGHASFCEKSIYFGLNEEQISILKEERSNKLKDTKENVLRRMGLSAKENEFKFPAISSVYPKVCDIPACVDSRHLAALVRENDTTAAKAPKAVAIILRYLQMLAPSLKKGTNQVIDHEDNIKKLEFFRGIFPRGSVCFTVPKEDPTVEPNPDYRIAEECKLFLVRWELQTEDDIACPNCESGKLIFKKVTFARTALKPIVDVDGKLSWAVGSSYKCDKCDEHVHATDPGLLRKLPLWMQQAYPVDNEWINTIKTVQIGRRLGALIEVLLTGDAGCDGHFVSYFLRKLYDNRYRSDHKILVEALEMHGITGPKGNEWTFEKWSGEFAFPGGDFLNEAFESSRKNDMMKDKNTSGSWSRPVSPIRNRGVQSIGHPSLPRSPGSEIAATDPTTQRKRAPQQEDYSDQHSKQSRLGHSSHHVTHASDPAGSAPPPAPLAIFVPSRGAMSPHTTPAYGGHQWPGYGSGPPFPVHFSPAPPRYHPNYGFGVRSSGRIPITTPSIPPPPQSQPQGPPPTTEDSRGNRGENDRA